MTSMITQEKPKCSPGSRTPDWYNPDYKNETTTENQKVLERIKQESLDRMKISKKRGLLLTKKQETVLRNLTGLLFNYSICVATSKNLKYIWRFTMNNETKAQLQLLSDNMSNLNYDEILFRSDILLRSIELITLIKRIEPEDFDEMINGYAEVLRFYAEDLKN